MQDEVQQQDHCHFCMLGSLHLHLRLLGIEQFLPEIQFHLAPAPCSNSRKLGSTDRHRQCVANLLHDAWTAGNMVARVKPMQIIMKSVSRLTHVCATRLTEWMLAGLCKAAH